MVDREFDRLTRRLVLGSIAGGVLGAFLAGEASAAKSSKR